MTVTFDWKKREAQYSCNGTKYRPSALVPGAFDPLSVLYALRLLDLKGIKEISKPVSDGLACVVVRATVLGKQKVRVESGEMMRMWLSRSLRDFQQYLIHYPVQQCSCG